MLSEKFILFLETLISHLSDGEPHIVVSTAPHVPKKLQRKQEGAEAVIDAVAALSNPRPAPISTA